MYVFPQIFLENGIFAVNWMHNQELGAGSWAAALGEPFLYL